MSAPRDNLESLVERAESQVQRQTGKSPTPQRSSAWKRWLGIALIASAGATFLVSAKPWLFGDSEAVVMHGLLEIARAARADVEANRSSDGSLPDRVRDPALAIMVDYRPGADGSYRVLVKDGQFSVELNERGIVVSPGS